MEEVRRRYVKRLTESMVSQILNRESSYEEDFFMRSEETDELLHVCRKENGSINVVFYNRYTNEMCFEDYDKNGKFIKRGLYSVNKEIKSVLDEEVVESILDEDSGWYLCGDKYDSIVEVYRDLRTGFEVWSHGQYRAGYNNEGEMIWCTKEGI